MCEITRTTAAEFARTVYRDCRSAAPETKACCGVGARCVSLAPDYSEFTLIKREVMSGRNYRSTKGDV